MRFLFSALSFVFVTRLLAQPFQLPTANRALLEPDGGGERYFVGTAGKPWTSGQFGCVRTEGFQFHEGMDIRPMNRDKRGEPTDPAVCSMPGVVAYVNSRTGLSNYGNYVVVRHSLSGLEVFTLYAHLASIRPGLKSGDAVQAGEPVGTMGRTSNTRQRITVDRAHLHFEINFMLNARYSAWHKANQATTRNDHANFNGQNLAGTDPATVFKYQSLLGTNFNLVRHLKAAPELCRVMIRRPSLDFLRRNPGLVEANPVAAREGTAGWELSLGFNGLPLRAVPRATSEITGTDRTRVLFVNASVQENYPCGKLLVKRGQLWTLTAKGNRLLDVLAY